MNLGSEATGSALFALGLTLAAALVLLALLLLLRLRDAQRQARIKNAEHHGVLDRLKENEYRLRAIIESEPECVKLQAADGTVLEINPAGLRLLDADRPQDIIGRHIYTFVAPEYLNSFVNCSVRW